MAKLQEMSLGSFDREKFLSDQEPHMRARFEAMHALQDRVDEVQAAFAKERKALELKYRAQFGETRLQGWAQGLRCKGCGSSLRVEG